MKSTRKKRLYTGLIILALFAVFIGVGAAIVLKDLSYIRSYNEACDPENTAMQEFVVARGESYTTIGKHLQDAGLIASSEVFIQKTKLLELGPTYQAGNFLLSPSMTMDEIMQKLQSAARETVRFTIPEGYTIAQTADKLEKDGIVSAADFLKALESCRSKYWFLLDLKEKEPDPTGRVSAAANKYEGFLFPDTYEIYKDSSAETVLGKFFARFDKIFDADMKKKMQQRGLTVSDVVIMASLIERECRVDEERPLIASVINNRLQKGQKLELDAAIQYILGSPKEGLTYADLEIESPYNIYKYAGLPPGPIASPGLASIKAVLEPAETEYYYYVLKSKSDITHNFAKTYKEFEKYKKQYKNSK